MSIRDRIVELRRMPAGELLTNPKNWRTHPAQQKAALTGLLKEIGYADALLARPMPDGKLMLVDGHLRKETTPNEVVPVLVLDLNEAEADKLLATLDPLAAMAGRDQKELDELLARVQTDDAGLRALLESLTRRKIVSGKTEPDEVGELAPEPWVETGDLFELGDHRLLCGDATKAADVDRVMSGEKASICWTDPPWNVAYGESRVPGGWSEGKHKAIANDNLGDAFPGFCAAFSGEIARVVMPGAPIYLAMSAQEWPVIHAGLCAAGFHWSSTVIWAKDALVLSRKDYHTQYEPIWYGWRDGASRLVRLEDRKQSDLWHIPRPKRSDSHPTMKPVELVVRSLVNSSRSGDIVFEPFSGSGSTLIACEQTGRTCRAIELDPGYVQVAIERWQAFTGRKAVPLGGTQDQAY